MDKNLRLNILCELLLLFVLSTLTLAQGPRRMGGTVEKVADGFQFVEGPVWKDGVGLLFSDIWPGRIYRWTQDSGAVVFLQHSDSSNGLTFDRQGRLVLTQMQKRRVARMEANGTITPLATTYLGKRFNSPNDVVVKSNGGIFFTDPNFNIPAGQAQEMPYCGIFCITPSGNIRNLDSSLALPNGICFSRDESRLYVNNSAARIIYVWDVVNDSTLANKRQFASIPVSGYADGMKADSSGNIFCAGPLGIWVFSPSGSLLDTIRVPGSASNCNWGDSDRKTLYITGGTSVYRIRPGTTGIAEPGRGGLGENSFELYPNYPNPFNPTTVISYQLSVVSHVRLVVYDLLGREVAILVNEEKAPGHYQVRFSAEGGSASGGDGSGLSSGAYFYRMQSVPVSGSGSGEHMDGTSGGFTQTRRLLLVR